MRFDVTLHFSAFHKVLGIEAENEAEALKKARAMPINYQEIKASLEAWHEADEITMVVESKGEHDD